MKIFNRQITVEKIDEEVTDNVEVKEDEDMDKVGFFARHKKGLIIGAVGTVLAAGAAMLIKSNSDDTSDDYEDDYDVEESESTADDSPSED